MPLQEVFDAARPQNNALGCMTPGMFDAEQAPALEPTGLDYYKHNIDSAPEFAPTENAFEILIFIRA